MLQSSLPGRSITLTILKPLVDSRTKGLVNLGLDSQHAQLVTKPNNGHDVSLAWLLPITEIHQSLEEGIEQRGSSEAIIGSEYCRNR